MKSSIYQQLETHNAKTFGSLERMNARLDRFEAFAKKDYRSKPKVKSSVSQQLEMHHAKTFGSIERMNARLERFEAFAKKENRTQRRIARKQRRMIERVWRERQKWSNEPDESPPEQEEQEVTIATLAEDDTKDAFTLVFFIAYIICLLSMVIMTSFGF